MGNRQKRYQEEKAKKRRKIAGLLVASALAAAVLALAIFGAYSNGSSGSGPIGKTVSLKVGNNFINANFNSLSGKQMDLAAFKGEPVLLWLVTTWCSSCQAGTQQMANNILTLSKYNVKVLELENYNDFNQPGPSLQSFYNAYVGKQNFSNWIFGTASEYLTTKYNPQSLLDIYYLISPTGKILDVGSAPSENIGNLLSELGPCC